MTRFSRRWRSATKPEGVYRDGRGGWYVKVTVGRDPGTGRRDHITRRGFRTAAEAAKARRELLGKVDRGELKPSRGTLTVNELLDLYLYGIDADRQLSAKTCFDYRHYADHFVRPTSGPSGSGTSPPKSCSVGSANC